MLCNCGADSPQRLLKALSSVWFCDQIVFLSDNSTQESLDMAEKFGCDIHHWKGRNSMADRRNHMMQFMKNEYILVCDSDEVYDWSTYHILKWYISKPHEEYIHAVRLINVTSDGIVQSVTPLERMFKKGVKWDKDIQNQLSAPTNIGSMIQNEKGTLVDMYHDGYGDVGMHALKQWKRIPINEEMVRSDPEDAHTRMFLLNALVVAGAGQLIPFERILAVAHINIEEFDKSEKNELYCKVLQKTLRFYYIACADLGRWPLLLDELEPRFEHVKYHPDCFYWMFRCNYEMRNAKEAVKWGERFIREIDDKEAMMRKNIEVTTFDMRTDTIRCIISALENMEQTKWTKKQIKRWNKCLVRG